MFEHFYLIFLKLFELSKPISDLSLSIRFRRHRELLCNSTGSKVTKIVFGIPYMRAKHIVLFLVTLEPVELQRSSRCLQKGIDSLTSEMSSDLSNNF